ncbi:MAG TPA: CapA family protein, partial [Micropepsaceae bacterium]|nr:CapA family protein [Micropepsaceae bacterium]
MATMPIRRLFPWAAALFASALCTAQAAWAQAPSFTITLTGQSMIRSDIRVHVPAVVPRIKALLKGDVVFTNFETTILDVRKGQSPKDGRFLSPPETLEALKTFGFNLVSL